MIQLQSSKRGGIIVGYSEVQKYQIRTVSDLEWQREDVLRERRNFSGSTMKVVGKPTQCHASKLWGVPVVYYESVEWEKSRCGLPSPAPSEMYKGAFPPNNAIECLFNAYYLRSDMNI